MPRRTPRRSALLKLGAVLTSSSFALAVVAVRADEIRLVPGATVKSAGGSIKGQITSESPAEVKIKAGVGGETSVPVDQVESVSYEPGTPSLGLADSRANIGNFAEAVELYQKAAGEAQGKPLLERAALFGKAEALAELALGDPTKTADATAALEGFVKAHPNSRQVGPALLWQVKLHLNQNDPARAEAMLSELTTRVPWASDRVAVLKARIQARKGDADGAVQTLDALIARAPAGSPKAREALLAKAESLAAARRFPEAEAAVRQVIDQAPPEDDAVQAEAHNTLGDCLRAAGRPKDALLAYLRTDILYSSAKDQHAKALARVVDLWRELKQDGRANEVLERLKQQYPQSPYVRGGAGK